ncbi:MAG: glycogen-binding domain-containing protein [Phycisphaerae bacterium]
MVDVHGRWAEFRFFRPGAKQVRLAGEFNDWDHRQLLMAPTGDGWWEARMKLPAGSFRFKYWADGQWFSDYAAFGLEPGPHGYESVVRISETG